MITEMAKGVYWVGAVDWAIRHFHGFDLSTHRGTTYNSYLIMDKLNVLVDTVWAPFQEELLANISRVIDPSKLDLIVTNHAETDHSGALPRLMELCPNATIIVSKRGLESVPAHYHKPWKFRTVANGEKVNIGHNDLVFLEAPMLHWPDSMFTYLTGHNILMPNDAFGQHYASAFRFNDQVDQDELFAEGLKYYANILTPFSDRVLKKIDEVIALNLPVSMIAPSHGVIWRNDPLQIVKKYQEWATQKFPPHAAVIYDTMWNGTENMAKAIGDGLSDEGLEYKLLHAAANDRNDMVVEIFKSNLVVLGSPTINNSVLPTITPIVHELKSLRFQNKIGAAFGCYGWSGESVKHLEEILAAAKIPIAKPGLKFKWQPKTEELEQCRCWGRELARAAKQPGSQSNNVLTETVDQESAETRLRK